MRQNSPQKLFGISDFAQLGIGRLPAVSEQIDQYGLQQIKTLAIEVKILSRRCRLWLSPDGIQFNLIRFMEYWSDGVMEYRKNYFFMDTMWLYSNKMSHSPLFFLPTLQNSNTPSR